jgi:hypothetical protein
MLSHHPENSKKNRTANSSIGKKRQGPLKICQGPGNAVEGNAGGKYSQNGENKSSVSIYRQW